MALKKLTPIEMAIGTIDEAIHDLKLQRQELVALLPKRKPTPARGFFIDHEGKKRWWDKRLKRQHDMKKRNLKAV